MSVIKTSGDRSVGESPFKDEEKGTFIAKVSLLFLLLQKSKSKILVFI